MFIRLLQHWHHARFDKTFFWIVCVTVVAGLFVFISGALAFLHKNPTIFYHMLMTQLVLGLAGGCFLGYLFFKIPYVVWKKYALPLFIAGIVLTCLVFIPGLGMYHGGARSWVSLGFVSFQPAEFLKIAFVIYVSAWYAWAYKKVDEWRYGMIPLIAMLGIVGGILLLQPDTGTFIVVALTGLCLYFVSGARLRDLGVLFLVAIVGAVILVASRPYLLGRIKTFLHPSRDIQGASYQVYLASLALGSGGTSGRGYGQSIQKFQYLPEPAGDSIFAVVGEESGFIGVLSIILLYIGFALRGLWIARRAPNMFARLLTIGLVLLVIVGAFLNIASIIGLFPLTGLPLIFMSQGGTSLMVSIASMGIILNISQHIKKTSHFSYE